MKLVPPRTTVRTTPTSLVSVTRLGSGSDGSGDNVLHDDGTWSPIVGTLPDGVALGDILVWDGDSWEIFPVGTDGQIIYADSGETLGLLWDDPSAIVLSDATPVIESGAGDAGASGEASRSDHVHPEFSGTGGTGLVDVTQSCQATGSPASSLTWDQAPASGSLLVLIGQNNGSNYSSLTQTNVTWTNRRNDSVGGIGDLFIWTGAVSGAGGTTTTLNGGSGGGQVFAVELPSTTYSALGSNGIYATQTSTNIGTTGVLKGVPAGRLVCFILHGQGTTVTSPALMSCPQIWSSVDSVGGLAFGFATGHAVTGYNATKAKYYTLVDIVPA